MQGIWKSMQFARKLSFVPFLVVYSNDLVAGEEPPVHVGRAARHDVPDRNLGEKKISNISK